MSNVVLFLTTKPIYYHEKDAYFDPFFTYTEKCWTQRNCQTYTNNSN